MSESGGQNPNANAPGYDQWGNPIDPSASAPAAPVTQGRWVDAGDGTWSWIPGTDPANLVTPQPTSPPPSATTSGQGLSNTIGTGTAGIQADIARRQGATGGNFAGVQSNIAGSSILNPGPAIAAPQPGVGGLRGGVAIQAPAPVVQTAAPRVSAPNSTQAATAGAITPAPAGTPTANTQVQQAGTNAKSVVGPAPTVDMGIADRDRGAVETALGQSQQVVDQALAPVDQTNLNQSVADARNVLAQLLNGPNTANRIGAQTLRAQLALARSAAGGPGAVQEALTNAQQQAPELEAQAAQAGTAETMQRLTAAGNVAGGIANTTLGQQQNITSRIGTAATAVSGSAGAALGASGQNIDIAKSNQDAASKVIDNITQLTGTQLNIDEQQKGLIGQMARDAASMDYNWAQLDVTAQEAEFDKWVSIYGIDTQTAAQIKAAGIANHKGPMDYLMGIVGAAATVGAAAIKK